MNLRKKITDNEGILEIWGYASGRNVALFGQMLDKEKSKAVANHSPEGFNWGYMGSGPSQLALAILLEILPQEEAVDYYGVFKQTIIAHLPEGSFNVRVNFDKWYAIINGDSSMSKDFAHSYDFIEFKIKDNYFSKFLDLPSLDYSMASFTKGTKEFELLSNLSVEERKEYESYIVSKTTQKVPNSDSNEAETSTGWISYTDKCIIFYNLLGDSKSCYTGNLLELWD